MIVLKLTKEQTQALINLMDAGVRASGIQAVASAAELIQLITLAAQENDGES